ncbi:MAG: putative ATP-dependent RNA helicase ddx47 [Paramarteilia canceri]
MRFKSDPSSILVATDVASRGLDIPHVDVVINYDVPIRSKDYIHRVGRTARAGRSGRSITCVTQYDIELYQKLENLLDKKLPLYTSKLSNDSKEAMLNILDSVSESSRLAKSELSIQNKEKKKKFANKLKKKPKKLSNNSENDMRISRSLKSKRKFVR